VRHDDDDNPRPTPAVVVGAVAAGTVPLPFLAIYAVLFIVHGTVHPVAPPDITATTGGELIAGIIAAVIFAVSILALVWVVNGHRRWPFLVVELGMLGSALYFLIDGTKGGTVVSVLVGAAALVAIVLMLLPQAATHYRPRPVVDLEPTTIVR
jgi:hypothetical protein